STAGGSALAQGRAQSKARVHDAILARFEDRVLDVVQATSATMGAVRVVTVVAEQGAAADMVLEVAQRDEILLASAGVTSFAQGSARTGDTVAEEGYAQGWLQDAYGHCTVWTCESATFGMSRLLVRPVQSLALVNGELCACSPEGLVVFDAPAAAPLIRTGLTDFGLPNMKRGLYAYVGYSGAPMTLSVGNTALGQEVAYSYPLPARTAEAETTSRAQLGRGARSRYWRFTLTGTTFELHDVALELAETSRKI
ncbi:MAG TPA: hypothetical protein DCR72_00500, partial [Pseudomonas sp.]|nr:hypothetical protein [Pseudomonas sp.]